MKKHRELDYDTVSQIYSRGYKDGVFTLANKMLHTDELTGDLKLSEEAKNWLEAAINALEV